MMNATRPAPIDPAHSAVFLDLDGTLIEFGDSPMAVVVPPRLQRLLRRLAAACDGAVAIVTGRRLDTLDALLAPLRLPAAGLHGLERRDAAGILHRVPVRATAEFAAIAATMDALAARLPGVLVEDKGAALALHYRAAPRHADAVGAFAAELEAGLPSSLVVQRGHMVVEVRPAGADKGSAIDAFLGEPPFAGRRAVFAGDDRTDEHGFAVVAARGGLAIKVGAGDSLAAARLADPAAVLDWLEAALPRTSAPEHS